MGQSPEPELTAACNAARRLRQPEEYPWRLERIIGGEVEG